MASRDKRARIAVFVAFIASAINTGGSCDCFFDLQASVTDCDTHVPVAAADVAVTVNRGFDGRSYVLDERIATDGSGKFAIHLNEPCESKVTFTLSKDGYQPLSRVQDGARSATLALCLQRAVAQCRSVKPRSCGNFGLSGQAWGRLRARVLP